MFCQVICNMYIYIPKYKLDISMLNISKLNYVKCIKTLINLDMNKVRIYKKCMMYNISINDV